MTPFAREHIKHAHHGRETCGVLAESTSHTIGASMRSIIFHFLNCFCYSSLLSWPVFSRDPALVASIYVYWTAFCIYLSPTSSYLARLHSLNIVKYQTFFTPWRDRRDHVSHMRLDCLRRACQPPPASGDVLPKFNPSLYDIATAGTIALAVTPSTTVQDICEAVCERGFSLCHSQGPIYLMGLWRLLRAGETMSALGICGLRHFIMPPRLRGGAGVVNEHGWEQGALNPDGSSKSAEDIDFGGDPRTPPPGVQRPKRGKRQGVPGHFSCPAECEGKGKRNSVRREDSMYSRSGSDDDPNYIACLNVSYLSYPPTWSQVGFLL
ncbi:hypothetical protein B0H10DRAFT_2094041 [Mycena sp. CBHHK59/15]|nr:hypothetical protein B0H10DRAFT_2094041 [Mycena sp. CBHHK59/15]